MIGGLLSGAMTLIALQVFSSDDGPARGGALMVWVSKGVQQIISADRAAIPNLTKYGAKTTAPTSPPSPAPGNSSGSTETGTMPRNPLVWT